MNANTATTKKIDPIVGNLLLWSTNPKIPKNKNILWDKAPTVAFS